jgi:CelD/BcsL family acetyltransferase involved in cellulose biosynthesis
MPDREALSVVVLPVEEALGWLRRDRQAGSPGGSDDPTLAPEWLELWWRHFGTPGTDRALALISPAGDTVGVLFTRLETERYSRLPVRTIRSWVNSHAQRASLILRCDENAAARAVMLHWIRTGSQWDFLRLQGLPDGTFARALLDQARILRCCGNVAREWGHSRLVLDRSWDSYYFHVVSPNTRREVERQGRRLDQLGVVSWALHESPEAVAAGYDDFISVEAQSWKRSAGEVVAGNPAVAGFYRDVTRTFAATGQATVAVLRLDDAPICAALVLTTPRRILTLKTSFDERFAKYSPGSQAFKRLIARAVDQGFKEFDFYGKMAFSQRWTKDERCFIDLDIQGRTIRSRLVACARDLRRRWSARRQDGKARHT